MKNLIAVLIMIIGFSLAAKAQVSRTPEQTIREFYTTYTQTYDEQDGLKTKPSEMKKYITERYYSVSVKYYKGNGYGDFFLNGSGEQAKSIKEIKITNLKKGKSKATADVYLIATNPEDNIGLAVVLVKEKAIWKIDNYVIEGI